MRGSDILKYLILAAAQVLLWNFCNFTQFLTIVYLPVMILFLPVKQHSALSMLIAFATGLAVDFFAGSPLGLCSLALVPVAFLRKYIIILIFGSELYSRNENLSVGRQGWEKIFFAIILSPALFLAVYIIADSAGTRPVWIDLVKGTVSLLVSAPISLYIAAHLHGG